MDRFSFSFLLFNDAPCDPPEIEETTIELTEVILEDEPKKKIPCILNFHLEPQEYGFQIIKNYFKKGQKGIF